MPRRRKGRQMTKDDKIRALVEWIIQSGVTEMTEKVILTITKESISVEYQPPLPPDVTTKSLEDL